MINKKLKARADVSTFFELNKGPNPIDRSTFTKFLSSLGKAPKKLEAYKPTEVEASAPADSHSDWAVAVDMAMWSGRRAPPHAYQNIMHLSPALWLLGLLRKPGFEPVLQAPIDSDECVL
jgi:hypothetical protein